MMVKIREGFEISGHRLLQRLNNSGYYEEWEAEEMDEGRLAVVRFIVDDSYLTALKEKVNDISSVGNSLLAELRHIGLEHENPHVILEFCEGMRLESFLQEEGIIPPAEVLKLWNRLIDCVDLLHEKGLMYGFINPDNVIIEKLSEIGVTEKASHEYVMKMSDGGLNVLLPRSGKQEGGSLPDQVKSDVTGFHLYQSPEYRSGHIDSRSDIYSAGVILFEMLTGGLPYGMELPSELNPVVPDELDQIVKKCLKTDKDSRYQGCKDVIRDIGKIEPEIFAVVRDEKQKKTMNHPITDNRISLHGAAGLMMTRNHPITDNRIRPKIFVLSFAGVTAFALLSLLLLELFKVEEGAVEKGQLKKRSIMVSSIPLGSNVYVDEVGYGSTPTVIDWEGVRTVYVVFKHRFYNDRAIIFQPVDESGVYYNVMDGKGHSVIQELNVLEDELMDVRLTRKKARFKVDTGKIVGAFVYVDGSFIEKTPMDYVTLDAGVHTIKVAKKGYDEVEFDYLIDSDDAILKNVMLSETGGDSGIGTSRLVVESAPEGAVVVIDGEEVGTTPIETEITPGTHDLSVNKEFYQLRNYAVEIDNGGSSHYFVTLERQDCILQFSIKPSEATVILRSIDEGEGGIEYQIRDSNVVIPAGYYEVEAVLGGYKSIRKNIKVLVSSEVDIQLQKIVPGTLVLKTPVPRGNLYIDGMHIDTIYSTKYENKMVNPGRHWMIYAGVMRYFDIEGDRTTTIEFTLDDLEVVEVPAGDFIYGAELNDPYSQSRINMDLEKFYIDRYEVSNRKYSLFLEYIKESGDHSRCLPEEGKKDHTPLLWDNSNFNKDEQPVVGIDYYDVVAYARWCGKEVPSEYQWEKSAKGKSIFAYPWGNKMDHYYSMANSSGVKDGFPYPAPVKEFDKGKSVYGCFNMIGNVAEWCSVKEDGKYMITRGGSFMDNIEYSTITYRVKEEIGSRRSFVGFRTVFNLVDQK